MVKKIQKQNFKNKSRHSDKFKKSKTQEEDVESDINPKANNFEEEEFEEVEGKGNKADFYLDDADMDLAEDDDLEEDNSENLSLSEDDAGSDLDFAEDDYIESEEEKEEETKEAKEEEKAKEKKITKFELKKIIKKCGEGVPMAITKMIIIFTKISNPNQKFDSLDEDDIMNKPKIVQRLLKFCLKNLPEILVLKLNSINDSGIKENNMSEKSSIVKNLIKRYLATLSRYVKTTENAMLSVIYKNMGIISELIFMFRNFIEIFLKLSIKVWATRHGTQTSSSAYKFTKETLEKKPEYFEISLKYLYINYLEIAKATNWNTVHKIKLMQNEIIKLLALDLQKAYITIFTFIRKLCLQLRITINDKRSASIKNIYNWQFINSLKLWSRIVTTYHNRKNSEINLLAYPLIQTILGVLRLNLADTFFPLRISLVNMLNEISHSTQILVPVSTYLIEVLESNHFKTRFREKNLTQNTDDDNNFPDLNVSLKFKKEDFRNYGRVQYLLEQTVDSLTEYLALNSYKYSFPEMAFGVSHQLKKIIKIMMDKNLRESLKTLLEKITAQSNYIEIKRKETSCNLLELEKVKKFEEQIRKDKSCEMLSLIEKIRAKREASLETRVVQNEDKFIEI